MSNSGPKLKRKRIPSLGVELSERDSAPRTNFLKVSSFWWYQSDVLRSVFNARVILRAELPRK